MKFAEHLAAHITPEWRKQYIEYEEMKAMLYKAIETQLSAEVADPDVLVRYRINVDEQFFKFCEKELNKINTFFAEKLAEATRKFANLQNELELIKSKTSPHGDGAGDSGGVTRLIKKLDPRDMTSHKSKMHEMKLAFSEFYLSLVLLQNYQNLNFTGFRKIMKKHDKLFETDSGSQWREEHVDVAPFYTNKHIGTLIEDTENVFTSELEAGDRQKAMKRLRVPPLNDQQSPWVTFKVGYFSGAFTVLLVTVIITGMFRQSHDDWRLVFRLYRGTFLICLFLFLIGINVYGWKSAGVNHVLIFELDPRDHLSDQHLIEIASIFAVFWSLSVICYLYSDLFSIPAVIHPLILVLGMILFLVNPTATFRRNARFWLIRIFSRVFFAPFFRVTFADFWLADQLNSVVPVFQDFQYFVCFYTNVLTSNTWHGMKVGYMTKCVSEPNMLWARTILGCLPAWFRFAQCVRRWRDERKAFPHLVNAGKYSTTFFVVFFATMSGQKSYLYENSASNPWFILWIFALCVSSVYTYTWDVKMDWGLFDANASKEYKCLREEIVYSTPNFYYFAIVEDFILRFAWTLSVSLTEVGIVHVDLMMSILAPLEIFRRFIWNFFRLENEHLNNCGEFRAVRDISIAPMNAGDQARIIKMMDEPDGVINRKVKKKKLPALAVPTAATRLLGPRQNRFASIPSLTLARTSRTSLRPEVRLLIERESRTPDPSENSV